MFKAGERVWHIMFGWGVLQESSNIAYPLSFRSDSGIISGTYTTDGKYHPTNINPSIFYKEQIFDMSKPEPEIGTWGYFWFDESMLCIFGKLVATSDSDYKYCAQHTLGHSANYKHFSPEIPPHIKELMNGCNKPNP